MERQREYQEEINLGDIVTLARHDAAITNPGIVTCVLSHHEVEVYWNESFPREREYRDDLITAK